MNVAAGIEYGSLKYADRLALEVEGDAITYGRLNRMANRAAHALRAMGVERGDRVALVLPNTPLFLYCYFGALKLGSIVVSVNPALTPAEVDYVVKDSGARVVIHESSGFEERLSAETGDFTAIDVSEDSPAAIVYTSGTTGFPKGATLSHGNIMFNSAAKRRYLKIEPADRLLLFLPLFHCFGQNAIMNAALHSGATLVMQSGFDVERVLECLASGRANMVFGVPTNFAILLEKAIPRQLTSVRLFFSAAAPLPQELEVKWRQKFGSVIHQGYGLTETSPFASYNHLTCHRTGSVGTPVEGVEMAIADLTDGHLLSPGETGEIVIRGPNVMLGYWNRPRETAEAIRDGWFHSGDIGRLDAAGYFTVEDRLKDMVIVGGCNVYPAEVENALLRHPSVGEAAVYGIPDAVLGERVRAAVIRNPGSAAGATELMAHCRETLAGYKVPAEIDFINELPKNRTGKVLKRVLRAGHAPLPAPLPLATTAYELELRLMNWLDGKLGMRTCDSDRRRAFCDMGLTSLMAVELAQALAEWTGVTVTPTIAWNFSSAESLMQHLFKGDPTANLSDDEAEALLLEELELLER
jgi:long-chain acyl-CoA synthetase